MDQAMIDAGGEVQELLRGQLGELNLSTRTTESVYCTRIHVQGTGPGAHSSKGCATGIGLQHVDVNGCATEKQDALNDIPGYSRIRMGSEGH